MKNDNPEMHTDLMFPSKYLKTAEFRGKAVPLTIKSVQQEELQMRDGTKETKYTLSFEETEKRFVLNKTNANIIAGNLNEKRAIKWPGQKATLYPTTCQAFGKDMPCIRVKDATKGGEA